MPVRLNLLWKKFLQKRIAKNIHSFLRSTTLITYWSVTMYVASTSFGFSNNFIQTNVVAALQTKSASFSIPAGASIATNPSYTYGGNKLKTL